MSASPAALIVDLNLACSQVPCFAWHPATDALRIQAVIGPCLERATWSHDQINNQHQVRVELRTACMSNGAISQLEIRTDHPDASNITVPIMAVGALQDH